MLKEGVADDAGDRERIANLLRFASTKSDGGEQTVSMSVYMGRMKEGQDAIYYITADSYQAARNSPHLEIFSKLGVEVLLMYDRVDEWLVSLLTEFDGSAAVRREGRARFEQAWRRRREGGTGEDGRAGRAAPGARRSHSRRPRGPRERGPCHQPAHRLAVVLVSDAHGMSTHLERLLKAAGQPVPGSKPISRSTRSIQSCSG